MRKFKILPHFVAAIDNGNFGCSTEENTKDVYPLGQRQTRSFPKRDVT